MAACKFTIRHALVFVIFFVLSCQLLPCLHALIYGVDEDKLSFYNHNLSNIRKYDNLLTDEDRELLRSILTKELKAKPIYDIDRANRVKQALLDAGNYNTMSSLLEETLTGRYIWFLCWPKVHDKAASLTIFAPQDRSFGRGDIFGRDVEHQTFPMILREEDFTSSSNNFLVAGQSLNTCLAEVNVTHDGSGNAAQIGGANITHWNIYRDDYIVVHGVDRHFKKF